MFKARNQKNSASEIVKSAVVAENTVRVTIVFKK